MTLWQHDADLAGLRRLGACLGQGRSEPKRHRIGPGGRTSGGVKIGYRLGVDIGTTYTAAGVFHGGRVDTLALGNRALQVPSVLYLKPDGDFLVGEVAETQGTLDPARVAREFKRRIGDPVPLIVGGTPYSAEALIGRLLAWVVGVATERQGEAADHITLTHPASWGLFKRDLLGQAIRLADVGNVTLLTEPEAAAITYASRSRMRDGDCIVVYDLGGGTFDAAALRRRGDRFELLGTPEGIEHLGGVDFDEAIFQHVLSAVREGLSDSDIQGDAMTAALARLRRECVIAKETLSAATQTVVPVVLPGFDTSVRLNRAEFEDMLRPTLTETVAAVRRLLRSADLTVEQLSAIVLVGGSSRIPLVSELLVANLGRPVTLDTHPKHDVALGAALAAVTVPLSQLDAEQADPAVVAAPTVVAEPAVIHPIPPVAAGPRRRRPRTLVLSGLGAAVVVAAGSVMIINASRGPEPGRSKSASGSITTPSRTPSPPVRYATGLPISAKPLPADVIVLPRTIGRNQDVWSVHADGTRPVRLTRGSGTEQVPVISRDRRTVVYHQVETGTLRVVSADGRGDRLLFTPRKGPCQRVGRPAWSRDNSQLAVLCQGQPGVGIYLVRLDGFVVRKLVAFPAIGDETFSPDGKLIAYWSSDRPALPGGGGALWVSAADGTGKPYRLTQGVAGQDADPAWSPDGQRVAFRRRVGSTLDIWLLDITTGALSSLVASAADEQNPTWSPDGSQLAYGRGPGTDQELWVVNADGSGAHRVIANAGFAPPAWTPR